MGDYEADAPRSSGSEQPNRGPDIERLLMLLETADAASREIDAEIAAACDPTDDPQLISFLSGDDYPRNYTASIDAALTLVPLEWRWGIEQPSPPDHKQVTEAWCWPADWWEPDWQCGEEGYRSHPLATRAIHDLMPIALCLAALKAIVQIRALAPPDARASGASAQDE